MTESVLEVRPSWWNYAGRLLLFFVVVPALVWAVVFWLPGSLGIELPVQPPLWVVASGLAVVAVLSVAVSGLQRSASRLCVHEDRLVLERGILSKETTEIFIEDVRSIDVRQSVPQRIVGTGDLAVGSAEERADYVLEGIPRADEVRRRIVGHRQSGGV